MSVKVKSNNADKYLAQLDDIAPVMTNITSTAAGSSKIICREITWTKYGPLNVISYIFNTNAIVDVGEIILKLPKASSANFSCGLGDAFGLQITGTTIKNLNALPAQSWFRGQIIYPSNW